MKCKIVGLSLTYSVDPELYDNETFTVDGSMSGADLVKLTDDELKVIDTLSKVCFPFGIVQQQLSIMAQAQLEKAQKAEAVGVAVNLSVK
jgi:hypothetical protein